MYDPPSGKRLVLNAPEVSRREYRRRESPDPGLVREHLRDVQGRLAPGGERRPRTRRTSGSGRRRPRRSRSRIRRRTRRSISSTTPGLTCSRRRSRSRLKIGDQVVGHSSPAMPSCPKLLIVPVDRRPTGDRRHWSSSSSTSIARSSLAAPIRASWGSGSFTPTSNRSRSGSRTAHSLGGSRAAPTWTVAILDTRANQMVGSLVPMNVLKTVRLAMAACCARRSQALPLPRPRSCS